MLRIDFSELCVLVLDETSTVRRLRHALPKAAGSHDNLKIQHPLANLAPHVSADAACVHPSSLIGKARAVA